MPKNTQNIIFNINYIIDNKQFELGFKKISCN